MRPDPPPDPADARTVRRLVELLRQLKAWSNDPSFRAIATKVNYRRGRRGWDELTSKTTVADCFKVDRRRLDDNLFLDIVDALHSDAVYVNAWRRALRTVRLRLQAASSVEASTALPEDVAYFVGRESAAGDVCALAFRDGPRVVNVDGMAGVGKTALAVHVGWMLLREGHVDRVLFVDLRGYHGEPTQAPADPAAVLDAFLRALGGTGESRPRDVATLAHLFRRCTDNLRLLVVLDNAATRDQVTSLIPTGPGCITIITSRQQTARLSGAVRIPLDIFTADESAQLLEHASGPYSGDDERAAAATIADLLGHLPLALVAMSGRIRMSTGWTMADHLDRLVGPGIGRRRGDAAPGLSDPPRSRLARALALRFEDRVERALELSYQPLDAGVQRTLRQLAIWPGDEIGQAAAAALTGATAEGTARHLAQLVAVNLLMQPHPDRYSIHELVRAYALSRSRDEDRHTDRTAALRRLLDYYIEQTNTAMSMRLSLVAGSATTNDHPATGRAWLDLEAANVVAAVVQAASDGLSGQALTLAQAVHAYLYKSGQLIQALAVQHAALDTAVGDIPPAALALSHNYLGVVYDELAEYETALHHLQRALECSQQVGDVANEADALNRMATVRARTGDIEEAAVDYRRAARLFERLGDQRGVRKTRNNLGIIALMRGEPALAVVDLELALSNCDPTGEAQVSAEIHGNIGLAHLELGRLEDALAHLRASLEIFTHIGDLSYVGATHDNLGIVQRELGQLAESLAHHDEALRIFVETGLRASRAEALNHRAETLIRLGRGDEALDAHREALSIAQAIGAVAVEAEVRNAYGESLRATGQVQSAYEQHQRALALATSQGYHKQIARGYEGSGRAHLALSDLELGRADLRRALDLYSETGGPPIRRIEALLAEMARELEA